MSRSDYKEKLTEQLNFLRRSVLLFDNEGYRDEAIRMATTLRVVFHQTNSSTSLLTHLGSPELKFKTWPEFADLEETLYFYGLGLMETQVGVGASLSPLLDFIPIHENVSFESWWSQCVWKNGEDSLTRSQLVKYVANKDGGAHVSDKLPRAYKNYKDEGAILPIAISSIGSGEYEVYEFNDAHLVGIRQITHEVLNCQELMSLAV